MEGMSEKNEKSLVDGWENDTKRKETKSKCEI